MGRATDEYGFDADYRALPKCKCNEVVSLSLLDLFRQVMGVVEDDGMEAIERSNCDVRSDFCAWFCVFCTVDTFHVEHMQTHITCFAVTRIP